MTLRVYLILGSKTHSRLQHGHLGRENYKKGWKANWEGVTSPARYYFSEALGLLPGGQRKWTHDTVSGQNWLYKSCAHCVLYSRYKAGVFPPYIHSEIGNHWTDHADNFLE